MPEILYRDYRDYAASRIEVNNAMMALLAGSRLAAHTLHLTEGSILPLGMLFPAVEHINRFNLRSDLAQSLLQNADQHIASVSIPYALATHEDFVMRMLDFVKGEGRKLQTGGKRVKAWNMHSVLFRTCGCAEPQDWMESFHVLREVRNCIVHAAGAVSADLRASIAAMGPSSRAAWKQMNSDADPEALDDAGRLALTAEHVFSAFAVTKGVGREVNAALASAIGSATWARLAVEDYAENTSKVRNSDGWRRSLIGYVRFNYDEAGLTDADLEAAARQLGLWTRNTWSERKK